ncbi:MAG: hypothetical protein JW892_05105 [Anaerolineae bacterium]|nr:hypothetical protein [Anaerolineae bacterium]
MLGFILAALLLGPELYESVLRNIGMIFLDRYVANPVDLANDISLTCSREIFDTLAKLDSEEYWQYQERVHALLQYSESSEYRAYRENRLRLNLARRVHAQGVSGWAAHAFRDVIRSGTDQMKLEAYVGLADLLWSRGDLVGFDAVMEEASALSLPKWMSTFYNPGLTLLGGYVDFDALALRQPVHVAMVWQLAPEGEEVIGLTPNLGSLMSRSDDFSVLGWRGGLYQISVVENRIWDGGFGGVLFPREGAVAQLPLSLYGGASGSQGVALVYEHPPENRNVVLTIRGQEGSISGLSSEAMTIINDPCVAYVVTAKYRSLPGSQPLIGVRWLLKDAQSWDDNVSTYVVNAPNATWTTSVALLSPPSDAEKAQLWVLNINSVGELQVDDLGFFEIHLPCLDWGQ